MFPLPFPYLNYKIPRAYVKPLGDEVYYRVEWSLAPNKVVREALDSLRKEVKLDRESLIEYFSI
jgi:hypothetical protein